MELACASCGSSQSAESRFCSSCGAPLYASCPNCGVEQPATAAFCSSCGYALRGDAARAAPLDERQERRVVTIVFADLSGSTALAERLDPEDVRDLQSRLFDLVNAEVERFGGVTEKFVGDAVLAVFGIPRAHEDDPERAVRAALGAQTAFVAFAQGVADRFGANIGLRIGVNTGEVVAGREAAARGELMVSGDAVNVAARLQQAAEPGQVLVGARTRRATARSVAYARRLEVAAKGKSEAVAAWVAAEAPFEPAPRGVDGLTAPLIARDDEMSILTAVAQRVTRERAPQLVTLFGPAGVGKSRLVAELVGQLPSATVLEGRCPPYGEDVTYWPIAEAAKTHAGVLETDSASTARAKLRQDVGDLVGADVESVLEPILWTIGLDLLGSDESGRQVIQRLQHTWRRYLTALGRRQETVLVIEDIHWAAPELLDLLEYLADALADTSVLIICTARIELLETRPSWGAGRQSATTLTLAPLSPVAASELVNALLGRDRPLGRVGESILGRAEGNPFFVEEMLAMLIERGALVRGDDGWQLAEELTDLPLPDSVHGVIAARIDLLDAAARDALRRCSVVGRVFWPAAAGARDEEVAPLARRGLVSEQPVSSMAGMREFTFKHALTRDVAYASLPRTERRVLHRRVAEWIQEVAPDRGLETAELAAHHYGESLSYGEDDPAVLGRAGKLFLTAGRAALQRGAFPNAVRFLEQALKLAVAAEDQAAAQLGLAQLDVMESDAVEASLTHALQRLEAALTLAPPDARGLRSDVLAWRSRVLWLIGRWDDAMAAADEAIATIRGLPESPQLARALARRSQLAMLQSDTEAEALSRESLAVALRVSDPFAIVNARTNLTTVLAMAGAGLDPREVLEIVETAREIGAVEEAFRAIVNFVWAASGYVPVDDVLSTIEAGQARLAGIPPPAGLEFYLPISIALIQLLPAGRLDDTERIVESVEPVRLTLTSRIPWLGLRSQLLLRRGDVEGAGILANEQFELAAASREPQRIIPMACAYLPWAAAAGRHDDLRRVASECLAMLDDRWPVTISVLPAVRALAAAGEFEQLELWLASFRRAATGSRATRIASTLTAAEALLATRDGRAAEAAAALAQAAEGERRLGYAFDAAVLELERAAALEADGDREGASSLRAESDAFMAAIGCAHPF